MRRDCVGVLLVKVVPELDQHEDEVRGAGKVACRHAEPLLHALHLVRDLDEVVVGFLQVADRRETEGKRHVGRGGGWLGWVVIG